MTKSRTDWSEKGLLGFGIAVTISFFLLMGGIVAATAWIAVEEEKTKQMELQQQRKADE